MKTCIGHLDAYRLLKPGLLSTETFKVGGNARQRRRKIRLYKGNGWIVRSWLRVDDSAITTTER